jgi:hypothetical protein
MGTAESWVAGQSVEHPDLREIARQLDPGEDS